MKIALITGGGSGIGRAAALELNKLNFDVSVFSIYTHEKLSNDSLIFFKKCRDAQIRIVEGSKPPISESFDLIVDAILGIGFSGQLRNEVSEWVEWINLNSIMILII